MRTPPRPVMRDLDALPRPAWDLIDINRYREIWRRHHGFFSLNVATTRGCPYHCNWCAKPIYGQRYAVRSVDAVADEMAWLKTHHAVEHFNIVDDIFGLQPGWIETFAETLRARGSVTPFKCLSRADLLTDRTVAALQSAGCRTVWLGAESGSQRILDAMEKGTRVEQIHAAARRLHAAKIEVGFFLQFGYPGETREDIDKTLEMIRACRPDDIGISVSYPLPGTPFYERVKAQLGSKQHWDDSSDMAMMFEGTYTTEFYRALHRAVHREFRARRSADWLRRAVAIAVRLATQRADRRRLDRLAAAPHRPTTPLIPELTPDAASRPTAQRD